MTCKLHGNLGKLHGNLGNHPYIPMVTIPASNMHYALAFLNNESISIFLLHGFALVSARKLQY